MRIEKTEDDYNMFDWWKKAFIDNYANFDGRARRKEYWYFTLVNILAVFLFVIFIASTAFTLDSDEPPMIFIGAMIIFVLAALVMLIPSIAVAVRRLHDTGKSGWWYLLRVIPFVSSIGSIVLLVFYCLEGDRGQNEYGPDPKAPLDNEIDQIGRSY